MKNLKRYWKIYTQLLSFNTKSALEYRVNFIVQLIHAPAYFLVMYLLVSIAFSRTAVLGGFTVPEGKLLFAVFSFMYSFALLTFMKGIRDLLWFELRMGILDIYLTKPVNPQLMITFGKPNIELVSLTFISGFLMFKQLWELHATQPISLATFMTFLVTVVVGYLLVYLSLSTYATIGFVVSKAQQVVEWYDKASDYSQYPMPIFPASIQFLAFTVMPIAFFGYVPTLVLLGRAQSWQYLGMFASLVCFFFINQLAWKKALTQYSSASS